MSGITFSTLKTWHGGVLAVRRKDGLLHHVRAEAFGRDAQWLPLVVVEFPKAPGYGFLFADARSGEGGEDALPPILWVRQFSFGGQCLTIQREPSGVRPDAIGLADPLKSGRYFTTHPVPEGQDANPVLGHCVHLLGWESFTPVLHAPSRALEEKAAALAGAWTAAPDERKLEEIISNAPSGHLELILDALQPVTAWETIRDFGWKLVREAEFRENLRDRPGENFWLDRGFAPLAEWFFSRRGAEASPQACTGVSPPEDAVFVMEAENAFRGFLHAALHGARRAVRPRKGCAILATVRNEGLYLTEWIAHHRALGVEHFFLYSNDNSDGSEALLNALGESGVVTWIDNRPPEGVSPQAKAYGHAFSLLPEILEYEWVFVLDADEFITLNPDKFPKLADYFARMKRWETDGIALNWKFARSALNRNGLADLGEMLTRRNGDLADRGAIGEGWRLVKSVCRPARVMQSRAHHPLWNERTSFCYRLANGAPHEFRNPPPGIGRDPGFSDEGQFGEIFITHYYFKSMLEWTWKHARNTGMDPAHDLTTDRYHDVWANSFALQVQMSREGPNDWMAARLQATGAEMAALRALPGVVAAENAIRASLEEQLKKLIRQVAENQVKDRINEILQFIFDDLETEIQGSLPLLGQD